MRGYDHPTTGRNTTVITDDFTALEAQAAAGEIVPVLIRAAIEYGNRTVPTWRIERDGLLALSLHFTGQPIESDLAAWSMVLGTMQSDSVTYRTESGETCRSEIAYVTVNGVSVRFASSHVMAVAA